MGSIEKFAKHPIAANLMMIIMIVLGLWGAARLNTQFLPPFEFKIITVNTLWAGASPEDIERSITSPLEQKLRTLDYLSNMTSTSSHGVSTIVLDFDYNADISNALNQVKERVNQVSNLPKEAEIPVVSQRVFYESIARVVITGFDNLGEARGLIRKLERSLLDAGIAKVDTKGLPEEEIAIQISGQHIYEIKKPLYQIGNTIQGQSHDAPAGTVGRNNVARQLRVEEQRRGTHTFDQLVVSVDSQGRALHLSEIADIQHRAKTDEPLIFIDGKPAIEMMVQRISDSDALENAEILQKWVDKTKPTLPKGWEITVLDERWTYIAERINLLIENGITGLILVVLILYIFLNSRVAFWVAAGIPTVFLGTLFIMSVTGESLNMLSLFGLIMVLGVVVDDAIVVGEETLSEFDKGKTPLEACTTAATRMQGAVISSSLTTVAAFMPLLMLSDFMGEILFSIPYVVILVLLCSLFEAFYILPNHLYHALSKPFKPEPAWRLKFENHFEHFKYKYRCFLAYCLKHRSMTFAITASVLILSFGMVISGRVPFTFFPSPEPNSLNATVQFASGTPDSRVKEYLTQMEAALYQAEKSFDEKLVVDTIVYQNYAYNESTNKIETGSEFGSMYIELTAPDSREIRNPQIIERWKSLLPKAAFIESVNIESPKSGPPGLDIDVELSGANPETLKAAAVDLRNAIEKYVGVFNAEDDLPYGRTQWILEMTPQGRTLGLNVDEVARQVRSAFEGYQVQSFYDNEDEIAVRVMLPDHERFHFARFDSFPIITPNGAAVPLGNIATIKSKVGMQSLQHTDTRLAVHVTASVDTEVSNANRILASLKKDVLPGITHKYGVTWSFDGVSADEEHTLKEMKMGFIIGITMIYLILCWILTSFTWPFLVMLAIPFGLSGAIYGHMLLGLDLTLLSLFGLFGLAGIVINDSIIMIMTYQRHRVDGMEVRDALIQAGSDRLRAVLLTSLTTIVGLVPLMFETSLQALFLVPMAVAMTFGLSLSTILVLIVIPGLIEYTEEKRSSPWIARIKSLKLSR